MKKDAVNTISDAIKNHTIWLENVNKALICDTKPTETMIDEDAHLKCEFGRWLEENKDELKDIDLKTFYDVYEEHQRLHKIGREILDKAYEHNFVKLKKHNTISEEQYDSLLKVSKDIKKTLRKFRASMY